MRRACLIRWEQDEGFILYTEIIQTRGLGGDDDVLFDRNESMFFSPMNVFIAFFSHFYRIF